MKYNFTADDVRKLREAKGISMHEAKTMLIRDHLISEVVAAESFEDLKPAILAILEGDI